MRLRSRTRLCVEGLESRVLLAADVASMAGAYIEPSGHENRDPQIIIGDVNGDGIFDPSDLVEVFQAGKYQTDQPADWSQGDWNGDQQFDSGDLVLAFQSGDYSNVPTAAHANKSANAVRLPAGSSDGDLAAAIATAGPRGTVIVEAGVHTESSSVMITFPVTIIGEAGAVIEFDSDAAVTSPRLVDAGFHIKNTQQVRIQGLEIQDNDAGSTAILIEGSKQVSIQDNQITGFQYGVLVESADHSKVVGNVISANVPATSFGVIFVNGFGNQARGNTVSGATFGIFASGKNGKLLGNTTSGNFVGIILCNVPPNSIKLPDGTLTGAEIPATRWLVQGNLSANNGSVGYLVIDGSNNNILTNNEGGGNGTYDIELTPDTYRFSLPYVLPASYDNIVNAGPHQDIEIKDCGSSNMVHGGDQVDTNLDPCPVA